MTSRNTIHKTQTIAIYVRSGITAFWKKKILPSKNDNESTPKTSFTDYKADISPTPTEKRKAKNTIGKRTIIKVFKWLLMFLISSFLGGYIGHASEPIYNSIDAIFSQKHLILSAVSYGSSSIQNLQRLVHSFFRVLKYRSIRVLFYGYPALPMHRATQRYLQNLRKALNVILPPLVAVQAQVALFQMPGNQCLLQVMDCPAAGNVPFCLASNYAPVMKSYDNTVVAHASIFQEQICEAYLTLAASTFHFCPRSAYDTGAQQHHSSM